MSIKKTSENKDSQINFVGDFVTDCLFLFIPRLQSKEGIKPKGVI